MKALKADVFLLVCFLAIKVALPLDLNPVLVYDVTVMQNGFPQSGLNYRIPVVAVGPLNGTLVVVVEQRLGGTSDGIPKNIAYKYSEDNGITWYENSFEQFLRYLLLVQHKNLKLTARFKAKL